MTNGKLTVEATGIPVVVDIAARAGDTLLIINGVCVGVQGDGGKTKSLVAALRSPAPARKHGGRAGYGDRGEILLAALREHGPNDTAHLLDLMGIDQKNPDRLRYRQALLNMKKNGSVVPVKGDKNKPRPVWEIAK